MSNILEYKVTLGITPINIITVYKDNKLFCEIETLKDSKSHPVEEIETYLENNGYESEEFEFKRLKDE